ncbi:MAG: hypothetical protein ACYS5V_10010 [Planctomycetota bacterium]
MYWAGRVRGRVESDAPTFLLCAVLLFVSWSALRPTPEHVCPPSAEQPWAVSVVKKPDGELSIWVSEEAIFRRLSDDGYVDESVVLANGTPSQ